MKKSFLLGLTLSISTLFGLVGCGIENTSSSLSSNSSEVSSSIESSEQGFIDYTSEFKYDETSNRVKEIVTVENYVDGDTTHFKSNVGKNGVLKARYLGVDTPESTGKIQPWGKKASNFTRSKLESAAQIMIESNDDKWNVDSTAERYLVWVWYRPSTNEDWRLLNLEIMQNGFAAAKNIGSTCYAEIMNKAYSQALTSKLHYYSDEKDPDFPYGDAQNIDLCELRTNIADYNGAKVRVEGLVTRIAGQTAYIESYDLETERSYGLPVYMGYTSYPIIEKGNILSFVGIVQLYETAGTYQLSGLTYISTKPDYKDNIKLISTGNAVVPTEITAEDLTTNGNLLQATNVSIKNLTVNSIYTTDNGGNNDDAMTLTCSDAEGKSVTLRTSVLYKEDGVTLVTESDLLNKNISISTGIVDMYKEAYQIHVFSYSDIIINE